MSEEVTLHSISFVIHDSPLFGDLKPLLENAPSEIPTFELRVSEPGKEVLSPRLWDLPDVFRKKLISYSSLYLAEVQKMNRLSDFVRYNFSDGVQISAQEILRHRYHRKVTLDLLPNGQDAALPFDRWPLLQQESDHFVSQGVYELESIMQNLLAKILAFQRQKKIRLYLQIEKPLRLSVEIQGVDFENLPSVAWQLQVQTEGVPTGLFTLKSQTSQPVLIFDSFALTPGSNQVQIFPFLLEQRLLRESVRLFVESVRPKSSDEWQFEVTGDFQIKSVLQHLSRRKIPVEIQGHRTVVPPAQQWTEIAITETGSWSFRHKARTDVTGVLESHDWSHATHYMHESLKQGWAWVMGLTPKELAAGSGIKREWDTRLLKHSGAHHYLLFETLFVGLRGTTSDGGAVLPEQLVMSLAPKLKRFLVPPQLVPTVEGMELTEMISRSVLEGLQKWVSRIFEMLTQTETWLRSDGEYRCEGLFRRECELWLESFLFHITRFGFEDFKKPKLEFFKSLETENRKYWALRGQTEDPLLTLEFFQNLIPLNYQVYFNQKRIHELEDGDFEFEMRLDTDSRNSHFNWFELNPSFFLKGEAVSLDTFLHSRKSGGGVIEYKGQYYLIPRKAWPSLKRLEFFWEKLQKGQAVRGRVLKQNEWVVPRHQTLELLALRATGVRIRGDEQWNKICEFYDHLGEQNLNWSCPESLKKWLKPYQLYGVQWLQSLYELRLGALLADDMGLGKTLQTLSFLQILHQEDRLGRVMIVVPSSLVFNWSSEIQKFTPDLPFEIFSNRERERLSQRLESQQSVVLIVTYGLLMEHIAYFQQYRWNVVAFDEAQNLKNLTAKRTATARSLKADFKIALTGTPMENHYGEFYSILDLLVPGALGELDDFRKLYVNPTLRLMKSDLMDLKLKVKPLLLRRSKKEILSQLPDKQESVVSIAFESQQKDIYRDIALSYNESIKNALPSDNEGSLQLKMLTALLRLRQACSDPSGLPNVSYEKIPPKIETLAESLQEVTSNGESALVFTQFLKTLESTVRVLTERGIPVLSLHGGLTSVQRQKVLSEFQNAKVGTVLVMTLKTGGVGLNLTQASYVFHLEPWWNPAVENQATDRAHRLGQSKAVQVYRYIMHESLEEKIETLKIQKNEKFKALFQDFESDIEGLQTQGKLSREDFDYLLGLNAPKAQE